MPVKRFWWSVSLGLAMTGNHIGAAEPPAPLHSPPPVLAKPGCPAPAQPPTAEPKAEAPAPAATTPVTDAFAQAPEAGTEAASSFNPNMFGDLFASQFCGTVVASLPGGQQQNLVRGTNPGTFPAGTRFNVDVSVNGQVIPAGTPIPTSGNFGVLPAAPCSLVVPVVVRGAFKITENESPRPQDRVFTTYNYFNNVNGSLNPPGVRQADVHRETVGFEKTLLEGDASIGLRVPFFEFSGGDGTLGQGNIGDLTFISKYALINDRSTGNVLSGGLALTVPTGDGFTIPGITTIHATLFQPWAGFIYNWGNAYAHGFTSIVVPTDMREVIYLFNDLAVGYSLYRDDNGGMIRSIVPTLEVHINTPLNHRGIETMPIGGIDIVDLTAGTTIGLGQRATLSIGAVTPVTGPKPFDIEALAQFNFRF